MAKLLAVLLSRRYAAGAMGLLAAIMALSALAPDEEALAGLERRRPAVAAALRRLQPAEVARSPVFLAITAYVGLAVAASMVVRIRAHRAEPAGAVRTERFVARRRLDLPAGLPEAEERVRAAFRQEGFPLGAGLAGARGRAGFWGSMAFHAGLLVGLAGIAQSARGRFHGEMVLAEGFPLPVAPATLVRADPPEGLSGLSGVRLGVSDVSASYARGTQLTDVSAVLSVERPGRAPERRFVSVNVPTTVEGYQLTVHAYGYAPRIVAVDAAGAVRADGNAALRVLPPGTKDGLDLGRGEGMELWFYPDHVERDGRPASRSLEPVNPVLVFRWYRQGEVLAEGSVPRGGEASVSGHRVAFPGFVYWVDFIVARDPGLPWFAAGALLAVAGLAVRFAFHERSWRARLEPLPGGTGVEFVLSARYLPVLLEERASRLARRLAAQ